MRSRPGLTGAIGIVMALFLGAMLGSVTRQNDRLIRKIVREWTFIGITRDQISVDTWTLTPESGPIIIRWSDLEWNAAGIEFYLLDKDGRKIPHRAVVSLRQLEDHAR